MTHHYGLGWCSTVVAVTVALKLYGGPANLLQKGPKVTPTATIRPKVSPTITLRESKLPPIDRSHTVERFGEKTRGKKQLSTRQGCLVQPVEKVTPIKTSANSIFLPVYQPSASYRDRPFKISDKKACLLDPETVLPFFLE